MDERICFISIVIVLRVYYKKLEQTQCTRLADVIIVVRTPLVIKTRKMSTALKNNKYLKLSKQDGHPRGYLRSQGQELSS